MTRLQWELQRAVRALGLPGWVGVVLLVGCGAAGWAVTVPLRADAERLDAAHAALERRLAAKAALASDIPLDPQQQLSAFKQRFTAEKDLAAALGRLQALARRRGIQLEQAEFRFSSEADEPVSRYSMVLPFKSEYRALRRFTQDALLEFPGLAIEEVTLRRSDPKSAVVESQLKLVLFVSRPG